MVIIKAPILQGSGEGARESAKGSGFRVVDWEEQASPYMLGNANYQNRAFWKRIPSLHMGYELAVCFPCFRLHADKTRYKLSTTKSAEVCPQS